MKKFQITIFVLLMIVVGLIIYIRIANESEFSNQEDVLGEKIYNNSEVRTTFLDIGQGDATFIEFPDSQQMLVDCSEDARVIEALGRVMEFYDKTIDYLLITHPDSDHYGGCIDVMKRFEIKNIVYNGFEKQQDDLWQEFISVIEEERELGAKYFQIDSEDVWDIASSTIHFLYPDHSIKNNPTILGLNKIDSNNSSIVFKLSFGDQDILMMGDAEEGLEEYLIQTYGNQLDVEILKVGHHGSGSSSLQEFLDIVTPDIAIISAGKDNSFGHPSLRVLKRLERVGAEIKRTDVDGDIVLILNKDNFGIDNYYNY